MRIALLGDIALFGCNRSSNPKYKEIFAPVKTVLDGCDYVIGNLETPLTNAEKTVGGKSAYIKGTPEDVEILKYLNVSHVGLANNHAFDFKKQGLDETIRTLENAGIEWYGIDGKECTVRSGESTVELSGYCCYSTNAKGMGTVNILDPAVIEKELDESDKEECVPILSLHWGQEHVHFPNHDHVELARKLCKDRKVVIHGHHPHVIQGMEYVGQSLVLYSLGNFCFDDIYTKKSADPSVKLSPDNREALIAVLEIRNNTIEDYKCHIFSFDGNSYSLSENGNEKIREWTDLLSADKEHYNIIRSTALNEHLGSRKQMRDLKWYVKRLNIESFRIIVASKKNQKCYKRLIKDYIGQ